MKSTKIFLVAAVIWSGVVFFAWWNSQSKAEKNTISPLGVFKQEPESSPKAKPLLKYEFEELKKRGGKISEIKLEGKIDNEQQDTEFNSYLFSYQTDERKVTGLANIPLRQAQDSALGDKKFSVIVMLRGYVDQEMYETGVGTKRAGEVFAKDGFVTLAPDFLGYGESDMPPNDVWEERFLRLTTTLDLLSSLSLGELKIDGQVIANIDPGKIGIWGHSNGGMIALSILEITGVSYPTSLWAPVSQFFPYDILYYTDEFDDKGKALRKSLAEFESLYDVDKYSFDEYLSWIKAPIIIHQGLSDEYIPISWTQNLVDQLEELDIDITLYTYANADHNLQGSWDRVTERDVEFFGEKLE